MARSRPGRRPSHAGAAVPTAEPVELTCDRRVLRSNPDTVGRAPFSRPPRCCWRTGATASRRRPSGATRPPRASRGSRCGARGARPARAAPCAVSLLWSPACKACRGQGCRRRPAARSVRPASPCVTACRLPRLRCHARPAARPPPPSALLGPQSAVGVGGGSQTGSETCRSGRRVVSTRLRREAFLPPPRCLPTS